MRAGSVRGGVRRRTVAVAGAIGLVVGMVAAPPASAGAPGPADRTRSVLPAIAASALIVAVSPCPGSKVTRVVNGRRTCVPASRYAIPLQPTPAVTTLLAVQPRLMPLRPGKKGKLPVSARAWRAVVADVAPNVAELEDRVVAAIESGTGRAAVVAGARAADEPTFTVDNSQPDRATGTLTQTFGTSGGGTARIAVGITGRRPTESDQRAHLDMSLALTVENQDGSAKTHSVTFRDLAGGDSSSPTCPTADGKLPFKVSLDADVSDGEDFALAGVKYGTRATTQTFTITTTADGQLDRAAHLQPVPFTTTVTYGVTDRAQGLIFFSRTSKARATVVLTGTIDPATGQVTGAKATTSSQASGWNDDASATGSTGTLAEKMARQEAGSILAKLKEAEARAQGGQCTQIVLTPGGGVSLAPNAEVAVGGVLEAAGGARVPVVDWVAAPGIGSVAPTAADSPAPTFTVTGAATGPQTASITFTATSAAGISTATWVANGTAPPITVTIAGRVTNRGFDGDGAADVALSYDASPTAGDETNYSPSAPIRWTVSDPRVTLASQTCTAEITGTDGGPVMQAPTLVAHRNDDGSYVVSFNNAVTIEYVERGDSCSSAGSVNAFTLYIPTETALGFPGILVPAGNVHPPTPYAANLEECPDPTYRCYGADLTVTVTER